MANVILPYTGEEIVEKLGAVSEATGFLGADNEGNPTWKGEPWSMGGGTVPIGGLVQMAAGFADEIIEDASGTFLRSGILTNDPSAVNLDLWNIAWTNRASATNYYSTKLELGANMLVFFRDDKVWNISLSSFISGSSPTARTFGGTSGQPINNMAYGAGRFVAVQSPSSFRNSVDGTTWSASTGGDGAVINKLKFINNRFIAIDNDRKVWESSDGLVFVNRGAITSTSVTINDISYGNGVYVAVGRAYSGTNRALIYTSTNLTSWTQRTSSILGDRTLHAIEFFQNSFVTASDQPTGMQTIFEESPDGIVWTESLRVTFPNTLQAGGRAMIACVGRLLIRINNALYWSKNIKDGLKRDYGTVLFNDLPKDQDGVYYASSSEYLRSGIIAAGTVAVPTEANTAYYCRVK